VGSVHTESSTNPAPAVGDSGTGSAEWISVDDTGAVGWVDRPRAGASPSGVLIVPPIGYEYWSSHNALRELATRLSGNGHIVLRLDYTGTGDATGVLSDIGTLAVWKADIIAGVGTLRRLGASTITLIGLRLGASLALAVADQAATDATVAWAPIISGRRYVKEVYLLSQTAPEGVALGGPDARFFAGCVFTNTLMDDLSDVSLASVITPGRVLIIDRDDKKSNDALVDHLRETGAIVEHCVLSGTDQILDVPTEYATTPSEVIDRVAGWVGSLDQAKAVDIHPDMDISTRIEMDWHGTRIVEHQRELGEHRLVGIDSRPVEMSGRPVSTVVFLNSGSEHHIGSGRVWVELARRLAVDGYIGLRTDFRGWGESGDAGFSPGRPYDSHTIDDVGEIVRAVRSYSNGPIILVGLCASAWVALRRCWDLDVDGIVAFNPQLYWQPGDPVEASMAETRQRRSGDIARIKRFRERAVWTALDRLRIRSPEGRWLTRIGETRFPIDFWFAKGDDGIEYLRDRLGRRLEVSQRKGMLTVNEFSDLDHSMHRIWDRGEAYDSLRRMIDKVETHATTR
jgi:dienelactone hydrolase